MLFRTKLMEAKWLFYQHRYSEAKEALLSMPDQTAHDRSIRDFNLYLIELAHGHFDAATLILQQLQSLNPDIFSSIGKDCILFSPDIQGLLRNVLTLKEIDDLLSAISPPERPETNNE